MCFYFILFYFNSELKKNLGKKKEKKKKKTLRVVPLPLDQTKTMDPNQPPRNQLRQVMDSIEVFVFSSQ